MLHFGAGRVGLLASTSRAVFQSCPPRVSQLKQKCRVGKESENYDHGTVHVLIPVVDVQGGLTSRVPACEEVSGAYQWYFSGHFFEVHMTSDHKSSISSTSC